MQIQSILKPINRPQVQRMSQRQLRATQASFDFSSTQTSDNRWSNPVRNQQAPERIIPWQPAQRPQENASNNDKNRCYLNRGWFILFGGIFCLILIAAIVGIVLGIVLPMTTTSAPDEQVTSKMAHLNGKRAASMICSNKNRGSIAILNETLPSGWTQHSYNYTATKTTSEILFSFQTTSAYVFYLDGISVVDIQIPSIELLKDPGFEKSRVNTTRWFKQCQTPCIGQIISTAECSQGTENCLKITCPLVRPSVISLGQSFPTIIGKIYTLSFMINHAGHYSVGRSTLYIDII